MKSRGLVRASVVTSAAPLCEIRRVYNDNGGMKRVAIVAALVLSPAAFASDLDSLIARVVDAYGGGAAWAKVTRIDESGRVVPTMRNGPGAMTRIWRGNDNLRVEIAYPDKTQTRLLENGKGTNNGRE